MALVSFCFLDIWLSHSDFTTFMKYTWNSYPTTGGMRGLYRKLHCLKKDLRRWNKDVFGNVFDAVSNVEARVVATEALYDVAPIDERRT